MGEDLLYKQAMKELQGVVDSVLEDIVDFANENDYEKEWVMEKFQELFSKTKSKILKSK